MTTHAQGNARLLKLAAHLESPKRGLDLFDYSRICRVDTVLGKTCGTSGCAMGEMPTVWPRQWAFRLMSDYYGEPGPLTMKEVREGEPDASYRLYRRGSDEHGTLAVRTWFALEENDYMVLFEPDSCSTGDIAYGVTRLPSTATAAEVAANLRAYVAAREAKAAVESLA